MTLQQLWVMVLVGALPPAAAGAVYDDAAGWDDEYVPIKPPPLTCNPFSSTGVTYSDPNISVVPATKGSGSCCTACAAHNAAKKPGEQNCTIAVYHRDTSVCALKVRATT
jgi:hypothetical protein